MDNLTHTLYALALAKTGLYRTTPRATLALMVGANLPDVDLISISWGDINYLKYHRGITHSFIGVILGAFILASVIYYINNRLLTRKPASWRRLYWLSLTGVVSHILLDFTNSYGIRPFLPFSSRWYAWDIAFIIDPWMLLVLVLGLGLPFLFRLVNQEIGGRPTESHRGAIVCLSLILLYWVSKDLSHRQAVAALEQNCYSTGVSLRCGAMPKFFNPFGWYGIVETETAFHRTEVGWGTNSDGFGVRNKVYHKPEQTEIIESAKKGPQAQAFLEFARFPWFQLEPSFEGYTIILRDLRFDFATRRRRGFVCTIEMDRQLNLLSENFRF
jgi:inner membrane protein